MDQHGCAENDPNGPVFDPVHGVIHHFYQIHLAYGKGHGPDYGHFVSKDFVHWADIRTAIWNGLDTSVTPWKVTPYDNEAIFTGSATVVDGAGPNGAAGIVNVYPGLCNKADWPNCGTGTLLALAVPADYSDVLLTNWTKPSFNPIMENTQRDPSGAWKEPSGEWRLRTYDSHVYGSASDADFLAGKWYEIGVSKDFRTCECPSFYPLPAASPGFEDEYETAKATGSLPDHVHKTSCGGDWWQLGSYSPAAPKTLGNFTATPGWEDLFAQRRIDQGNFYASKDNEYPTKSGDKRRINWGWAIVPPASAQTLPREITFNAAARQLQQYPIEEIESYRGAVAYSGSNIAISASAPVNTSLKAGVAKQSEVVVTFDLPETAGSFGIMIGHDAGPAPSPPGTVVSTFEPGTDLSGNDYSVVTHNISLGAKGCEALCDADSKCKAWTWVVRGGPGKADCCLKDTVPCPGSNSICTSGAKVNTTVQCGAKPEGDTTMCTVDYKPLTNTSAPFNPVTVSCGSLSDVVNLLPSEKSFEIRLFADNTFLEVFFQGGRAAMTKSMSLSDSTAIAFTSTVGVTASSATVYPMNGIWVSADTVRNAPRVYN